MLNGPDVSPALDDHSARQLLRHVPSGDIPPSADLQSSAAVASALASRAARPFDLLVGGDVMLGGRASSLVRAQGGAYPFAAVAPLMRSARVVLANLEGPLARKARREARRFSYRVAPESASALADAGIGVVTLANNHLVDCGRAGVIETLESLKECGVVAVGAGRNQETAHEPAIFRVPGGTLGILGYYWNRRCAATTQKPGSAMDDSESLERDIPALRRRVDLLVVTSHWGVPYERLPAEAERQRARRAIDLGADAVVAHHPHVVQPLEIYRGRPIFYSVGNFAFGSGNSRAEGLLVGFRLEPGVLEVEIHALYVKNRDSRVSYQPKLLRGPSATRMLRRLHDPVGPDTSGLILQPDRAVLRLARSAARC
jgi:hypothetical protein